MVSLDRIREYVRGTRGQRRWIVVVLLVVTGALGLGIGTIDEGLDGDFPGVLPDDSDPVPADVRTPTPTPGEDTPTPAQDSGDGAAGANATGVTGGNGNPAQGGGDSGDGGDGTATSTQTPTQTPDDDASTVGAFSTSSSEPEVTIVNDSVQIQVSGVLPGDRIDVDDIVIENTGDESGRIRAAVENVSDSENGHTEPEAAVDPGPDGELSSELEVSLSAEWDGTDRTLVNATGDPVDNTTLETLDNESLTISSDDPDLEPGETATFDIVLQIPKSAGDEIQTDGVVFDITLGLDAAN